MLLNCGVGEDSWESLGLQRRSSQSILNKINPEYSLEGLMLKLKLQYVGHTILGKTEGRRKAGDRGWDDWMASSPQWTWVCTNCRRQWSTGKPGVLRSMELRIWHNLATEQQHHRDSKSRQFASQGKTFFYFFNFVCMQDDGWSLNLLWKLFHDVCTSNHDMLCCVHSCSVMCLTLGTHWTVAWDSLSMGFFRQEYWRGLPFPPLGICPTQGLNPCLSCLLHSRWTLPAEPLGKPHCVYCTP